jgi:hypothetical protein
VDLSTEESWIFELKEEVAAPETVHEIWLFPGESEAAPEVSASSFLQPENRNKAVKNKLSDKSL